MFYTKLDIKAA